MTTSLRSEFAKGLRGGAPFVLVIIPFGLLFGVVATEAGLNVLEALSFSVVVIAGAAQFTALQLLQDQLPVAIVLLSALCVNLRMAMYSAALTQHLGPLPLWKKAVAAYFTVDQTFATAALDYEKRPGRTAEEKFAFFMGAAIAICPAWYVFTIVGAMVGNAIPESFALDFAVPITFLAMIAPALRSLAHVAAAFTSVVLALALSGLPYNLGLPIAALCAMIVGAAVEQRLTRAEAAA
ncbi:MAG: AzlC family ABC transporter permease [Pseudomonadota bacterium]|nr:AzlC family ABC transporter permease [Pseudomonadota bacterium]MEE3071613.1 AzlC family ABC transporter permease [Pseudomonadota bacterium]